ncbi:MAG: Na/Pi symporter [Opitutus sp.]
MNILTIAGGVALILFAIRFLRKGLDRMFGHRLHLWVEGMSRRSRLGTTAAGTVFGAAAPSSTAQTLLALQLLDRGKLPPDRMLMFLLGANVGITVTVQLLAFRLFDWYPLFLIAGTAGYLWFRADAARGVGQSLLALGFVFLGMRVISNAALQLTADPDVPTVIALLENHHGLLVVFAAGLTLLTQSSTATIGLAIALAEAGIGTAGTAVAVVLGANLGLGLTSIVAGWPTLAGRQLACANVVLKGSVIFASLLAFAAILRGVAAFPGDIAHLAANVHTGFNILVALLGAIFAGLVGRLIVKTVPPPPGEVDEFQIAGSHLDPAALSSPLFALANASRETLQLAEEVKAMFAAAWRAYREHDRALARQVQQHDDRVDAHHAAIKHYLSRIPSDAMSERDGQLYFGLMHFASQLEAIADVVEKSIAREVLKAGPPGEEMAGEDVASLADLERRVTRRFELAILVLTNRDSALARRFQQEGEELKNWCIEAQRRHYQQLTGGDVREQEASTTFLDVFNALRRISGLLNTIGHTVIRGKLGVRPSSSSQAS